MERILLKNGAALRCDGSLENRPTLADILIEGERIAAVGPSLDVSDTGARVIDLGGATVMPGLGDAHTHISWPLHFVFDHDAEAARDPAEHAHDVAAVTATFLRSGYTTIIGAGVLQDGDDTKARAAIERGDIIGPRIVPAGMMVADKGGLGDEGGLMEVADGPASIREIVARQCDKGVRAIKLFISGDNIVDGFPSDDTYMNDAMLEVAVREADRHGAFITAHARGGESVAMAARTGVRIIHHACMIDDSALAAIEARGKDVWVCPGLHYLWAMVSGKAAPWGMTDEKIVSCGYKDELDEQVEGIKRMMGAGVQILSGGDFGHQWTMHGTYAAEMQRYVELCGMPALDAIHTGTRNFAGALGLDIGEIREGALADLLVLDGDPLEDIAILQAAEKRRMVFKGGDLAWINPACYP